MSKQISPDQRAEPGRNTVQLKLGTKSYLSPLFEYYKPLELLEAMEHAFSITLLRDHFYSGWAHVWKDATKDPTNEDYYVKITSPNPLDDVQGYRDIIPRYLNAVDCARRAFDRGMALPEIQSDKAVQKANLRFLPPFGLAMLNARSVLLAHYPPDETIDYKDYLHSRTTRRWESLLISNGLPGSDTCLLESIVDVSPITADGGSVGSASVKKLTSYIQSKSSAKSKSAGSQKNQERSDLTTYVNEMLSLLLEQEKPNSKVTQPLVALGAPVREWLLSDEKRKSQIIKQLPTETKPGNVPALPIHTVLELEFKEGVVTPVIIVDHPCNYYRGNLSQLAEKITTTTDKAELEKLKGQLQKGQADQLRKDLIGARWQVRMSQDPEADPRVILAEVKDYWHPSKHKAEFEQIARDQIIQFQNIANPDQC